MSAQKDALVNYCLLWGAHLAVFSCREELKCGEAVNFDRLDLVGCGVHLGDDNVTGVLVFLSQFVPDGSKLFAMSAPGGI